MGLIDDEVMKKYVEEWRDLWYKALWYAGAKTSPIGEAIRCHDRVIRKISRLLLRFALRLLFKKRNDHRSR